jgi:hypothetical protein
MQIEMKLASESHVPRFRAGVGTWRSGYMIPIRLPWRHRARPSATLHEIQVCPERQTCLDDATTPDAVRQPNLESDLAARLLAAVAQSHFPSQFSGRDPQSLHQNQRQRPVKAGSKPGKSFHNLA